MSIFDWLLGRGRKAAPSAPSAPRSRGFLVPELKTDHARLFEVYSSIAEHAKRGDWDSVRVLLDEFASSVGRHVQKENVSLYVRLFNKYEHDAETLAKIHAFKSEMDSIGQALRSFLRKFENVQTDSSCQTVFLHDWENLGNSLSKRIAREETQLYVWAADV